MEVPAGQDGIQRLLAAEQEAQAIVQRARQGASVWGWPPHCSTASEQLAQHAVARVARSGHMSSTMCRHGLVTAHAPYLYSAHTP